MHTNVKNQTERLYSYDDYLKEFLRVDPHKANKTIVKPYDYGKSLANKDIDELKVTLADLHAINKK